MSIISAPYTYEEKELLIQLIGTHPILEAKKTDADSINKKKVGWEAVCTEFNSTSSTHVKVTIYPLIVYILFTNEKKRLQRNVIQLKRCWDKLKRQRKAQIASQKRQFTETGGGSGESVEDDENSEVGKSSINLLSNIDTVVPHLVYEINNKFDSDALPPKKAKVDTSANVLDSSSLPEKSKCTSNVLNKTQVEKKLIEDRKRSVDILMTSRVKQTELEVQQAEELHNIKMDIEREKLEKSKVEKRTALIQLHIAEENLKQEVYRTKLLLGETDNENELHFTQFN